MRRTALVAAVVAALLLVEGCGGPVETSPEPAVSVNPTSMDAGAGENSPSTVAVEVPETIGRLGPALEGIYVESSAEVVRLANDAVRVESASSCESMRLQLLGGDGVLVSDFVPIAIDFGEIGSAVDPGGFTMVIDTRLVYVTLVEPTDVLGCTATIIPGEALTDPLPPIIATPGSAAWSVATLCKASADGTVAVSAYLVASDGGGAQVGFTLSGDGQRRTATELGVLAGRGPSGFIAAHRLMMDAAFSNADMTEDKILSSLVPEGAELAEFPVPGTATVAVEREAPGLSGSVELGDLRFRFRCAE